MTDLLDRLRDICGEQGVLTGDEVHTRAVGAWHDHPIRAMAIVRPRTTQQVSRILSLCHEQKQPVVTHGGMTGLVQGAQTDSKDLVLSLELMNKIHDVDVANRTLVVEAGARLQDVQEAAENAGMQFALDLGARGSCTIGGNVATNAGGNRVIRYGMAREQILGLEAVLADGTVLSSMNEMIKNNAGYDLKHLFVGSEGTLGVITQIVTRLRERPAGNNTALVAVSTFSKVVELLKWMDAGLGGALSSFEVMWRDYYRLATSPEAQIQPPLDTNHEYYVLLEAQGSDESRDQERFMCLLNDAIEKQIAEDAVIASSGRERTKLWEIRDCVDETYRYGPPIVTDVSMSLSKMEDYVTEVRERLQREWDEFHLWIFGHLGDGNLHVLVSVGDDSTETREKAEAALYEPLIRARGSVSGEHGIGLEKKKWLSKCRTGAEIEVMRRLKHAMDPTGILNPGKIFDQE